MRRRDFIRDAGMRAVVLSGLPLNARGAATADPGAGGSLRTAQVFNVREDGAVGDGVHKDTSAIGRAIDACSKAGGGTVWFPAGRYLTGAITLKSHMTLDLDAGATILGSPDPADYPLRADPWGEGAREISSLIYGEGLTDIALRGQGTIDGQGESWWRSLSMTVSKRGVPHAATAEEIERAREKLRYGRPRLIRLVECSRVVVEGLRLTNSGMWTLNPVFCEWVELSGLTILNPVPSPNTDGIDPESSRNVHISDCHIDVGDDCIAIKSGKDKVGRKAGKPCENITITNLTTINGHAGVAIGSEMSGGVRNVAISNCVFQGTERGIRIKSQRGRGGVVENIVVENVAMQNVREAIVLTMFYSGKKDVEAVEPVTEETPQFHEISIGNIIARGAESAGEITGLREMPISRVSLRGVRIAATKGFSCANARAITWRDAHVDSEQGPALRAEHVEGLELAGLRTSRPPAHGAAIELATAKDVFIHGCSAAPGTRTFLQLRETPSSEVVLAGNSLAGAQQEVAE